MDFGAVVVLAVFQAELGGGRHSGSGVGTVVTNLF